MFGGYTSKRNIAETFNIEPKQLRYWIRKKEQLLSVRPHIKRLNIGAKPRYPILEDELLHGRIQFIALYPNISECKWGEKWLAGFMRHYKLSNRRRTTVSQRLPDDLIEKQQEF
ncbi:9556_t:CDS:2 [Diversispora eburnea]|uniref:9556_t:CDS:1 n=1 Tax=Diversispora eburnea TaxID=1213867 RepID=A0A9N8V0R7_9GLOM|nr:9556_t:CDS:2 [Diversispora eburnea]